MRKNELKIDENKIKTRKVLRNPTPPNIFSQKRVLDWRKSDKWVTFWTACAHGGGRREGRVEERGKEGGRGLEREIPRKDSRGVAPEWRALMRTMLSISRSDCTEKFLTGVSFLCSNLHIFIHQKKLKKHTMKYKS